uniref:Uncharacterized protein n=1 Tax=Anguilla anguilla TaxID=7936 RepID=A0A0E9WYR1_ANGAN
MLGNKNNKKNTVIKSNLHQKQTQCLFIHTFIPPILIPEHHITLTLDILPSLSS